MFYRKLPPGQTARGMSESFSPASHHAALWPELDISPDDLIIEKRRFMPSFPARARFTKRFSGGVIPDHPGAGLCGVGRG